MLPQDDAVRVEELVNYFPYDYPGPASADEPFAATVTVMPTPWNAGTKLVHIGIKGYDIAPAERPRANLVFLIDTSGSMEEPNKLPLLINSMKLLVDDAAARRHACRSSSMRAAPARCSSRPRRPDKAKIIAALDNLSAGGSTAGAEGIRQAYQLAEQNFDKDGVNRVILATDGDFNVGITDTDELEGFVERERETGIFLSVLGFGMGNYNDELMQTLAQNGNGAAAYIDTLSRGAEGAGRGIDLDALPDRQGREDPGRVQSGDRLRIPADRLRDPAAEPRGLQQRPGRRRRDRLRPHGDGDLRDHAGGKRRGSWSTTCAISSEAATRGGGCERRIRVPAHPLQAAGRGHEPADRDADRAANEVGAAGGGDAAREARFAASVAAFGQILRGGRYTGDFSYDDVIALANANKGEDEFGYRSEFVNLVRLAKSAASMERLQRSRLDVALSLCRHRRA